MIMPILKSLAFTNLPARSHDPVANRRAKLVSRLEEQRQLLQDASYVRVSQRWTGKGDERRQVEKKQSVRPWWRADSAGRLVMCVYHGTKPIEFEKGKAAIAVPSRDKLPALIDTLIAAAKAGELDEVMTRAVKPVGAPKSSSRAA
jgi:DNA-binding MarR family transcriptional regulator